ncbi:unnamed protein product [Polarella glacialis]|uniref:Uncharacterized protein n=1 Tax=Polarella glacialis TaxID=89957 RepID=A0A813DZX5_POLGL|nr:unnamed protein product [Polarella glacialis]
MKMASRACSAAAWLLLLFPLQSWSQAANPAVVPQEAELESLASKFLALKQQQHQQQQQQQQPQQAQPEGLTGTQPQGLTGPQDPEPKGFSRRLQGTCSGHFVLHQCESFVYGNSELAQQCCRDHLEHVASGLPWWGGLFIVLGLVAVCLSLWRCCCMILRCPRLCCKEQSKEQQGT